MFPKPSGLNHVSSLFTMAETRLKERLEHDLTDAHLQGFDEFFAFLKATSEQFQSIDEIKPLTILIERLEKDFETGLLAFLCGMDQAAFDAMRDAMEVGYLLRDFTLDHTHISEWLALNDRERWNRYSPNSLRQRYASSQGVAVTDLLDSEEYGAHSSMLHVSPTDQPFVQRGVSRSPVPQIGASFSLADILHHARDTVFLLNAFAPTFSTALSPQDQADLVPHLREAFEHTMKRYNGSLMWIDIAKSLADARASEAAH